MRKAIGTSVLPVFLVLAVFARIAGAALPSEPDATWGVNGRVYSTLRLGDRIYIGGNFTAAVSPPGTGGVEVARQNLAAIDADTGELDLLWDPVVSGPANSTLAVHSLAASSDGTRIFAGGDFGNVDGMSHKNLVAIDAFTGEVDHDWDVSTNFPVWALETLESGLYMGGNFSQVIVDGKVAWRTRLAAVHQTTGAVVPAWKPSAGQVVKAIEFSPDGSRLYVGGNFKAISGAERHYIAALTTATGAVDQSWVATEGLSDFGNCGLGCVQDIEVGTDYVYLATGGRGGNKAMAIDVVTAALKWERYGNGDFQAIALRGNDLYAGGHFERAAQRDDRPRFITFNATTGSVRAYALSVNSPMGVWSLEADNEHLYMGGDFTRVSGQEQPGYAQFTDDGSGPSVPRRRR